MGLAGLNQRRFPAGGLRNCRYILNADLWYLYSLSSQRLLQLAYQFSVLIGFPASAEKQGKFVIALNQLPSTGGYGIHDLMEHNRVYRDQPASETGKVKRIFCTPLYPVD